MPMNQSELGYHIIEKVNTYKMRSRFPRLVGKNAFREEHGYGDEFIVKELMTDKGAMGWGIGHGLYYRPDLQEDKLVIGKKISEVFDAEKGVLNKGLGAFDFALHDLAGVVLNMPAHEMFGGAGTNPLPVYDTLIYFDDICPDRKPGGLAKIAEECQYGYDYGYRAFKIKIGRAPLWMNWDDGFKRDVEVVRIVRDKFPDCDILVDANDAYTPKKMCEYVDAVADVGLYWIEEPFRESEAGYTLLREHLDKKSPQTLIADGETGPDIDLLIDLYKKGLLGVFQMDIGGDESLGHAYGLTPWRQIMPRLTELNAKISPHAWGLKLKTHYAASFCAGYPGITCIEGITDVTEGVEFDAYTLEDGMLTVPQKPGFGMELIWGRLITEEKNEFKNVYQLNVFPGN